MSHRKTVNLRSCIYLALCIPSYTLGQINFQSLERSVSAEATCGEHTSDSKNSELARWFEANVRADASSVGSGGCDEFASSQAIQLTFVDQTGIFGKIETISSALEGDSSADSLLGAVFTIAEPVTYQFSGSVSGQFQDADGFFGTGGGVIQLMRLPNDPVHQIAQVVVDPFEPASKVDFDFAGTLPSGTYQLNIRSISNTGPGQSSTGKVDFELAVVPEPTNLRSLIFVLWSLFIICRKSFR